MSIYKQFCEETVDENGRLTAFSIHCADNFNFGYDVIDALGASEPERRALVWCSMEGETQILTFADLSRLSNQAANVLSDAGVRRGDRVMVALKRHIEYWYLMPALHKLGAVAVPVTHMLTEKDFLYRLDCGDIRAVIAADDAGMLERLGAAAKSAKNPPLLWATGANFAPFHDFDAEVAAAPETFERRETLASEPILMYFTSGTTGYPKAVLHDHTYPLAHIITAKYWQQVEDGGLHFTVAETGWGKASWGKMYGQWLCGSAVMVYDFDNFDPKQLTNIVNQFSVTSFCAPPTIYRCLVKKGMSDMPSLRHASTAGEALSPEVFNRFQERTGLELMEGYGQTESTLILANFRGAPSKPGSLGQASPLYHVALLKDDGTYAAQGELGEMVIIPPEHGHQYGIFSGYLNDDALYHYAWRGGVYHTGDIAWQDEDGYYWFHGRIDDVIKSGGYRIGPYEIEDVLIGHEAVLECSVVGVPDKLRGQAIKAFVVTVPGYPQDASLEKQLRDYCNARLAEYKWVRYVEIVPEMPKTISGKIRKNVLRES